MEIRLLGGSWHGKKIELQSPQSTLYLVKRPKKKKWSPMDLVTNPDAIFVIDQEIYERKYCRNVEKTDHPNRWLVQTKVAYIKRGSDIKDTTLWNLGFHCETRIEEYGRVISVNA